MSADQPIPEATWDLHRGVLTECFIGMDMSVKEIRDFMIAEHEFPASLQQYHRKFKKWNLSKNLKAAQWKEIHYALKRKCLNVDDAEVEIDGHPIERKKLRKELSRHNPPSYTAEHPPRPNQLGDSRITIKVALTPAIVPVSPLRLPWFDLAEYLRRHAMGPHLTPSTMHITTQTIPERGPWSINQFIAMLNPSSDGSSHLLSRQMENQLYFRLQPQVVQRSPSTLLQDVRCMLTGAPRAAFHVMLSYAVYMIGNHLEAIHPCHDVIKPVVQWLEGTIDGGMSFLKYLTASQVLLSQAFCDRLVLYAVTHGHLSLLKKLLGCGIDPDRPLHMWGTAATPLQSSLLCTAFLGNAFEIVTALLDANANPNICASHGSTEHNTEGPCWSSSPLQMACRRSDRRYIDALISYGAIVRLCDLSSVLSSHVSAFGATKILQQFEPTQVSLLEQAINDFPLDTRDSLLPLQAAAKQGDVEKVALFLKHGADPDGHGRERFISLFEAPDQSKCLARIYSPLTIAIIERSSYVSEDQSQVMRYDGVIMLLLNAGADVNRCARLDRNEINSYEITCKDHCYGGHHRHCKASANGWDYDQYLRYFESRKPDYDDMRATALQAAMNNTDDELYSTLLYMGADPNPPLGTPPLVLAVLNNDEAAIERLISHGAMLNHTGVWLSYSRKAFSRIAQYDALGAAASLGLIHIMDRLIKAGALVNSEDDSGHIVTALQAACKHKQYGSAEYLLSKGAHVDPLTTCEYLAYPSPLSIAVIENDIQTVRLLIQYNANINAALPVRLSGSDALAYTPLSMAIKCGYTNIAKFLYQRGAEIDFQTLSDIVHESDDGQCFSTIDALGLLQTCDHELRAEILIRLLDTLMHLDSLHPLHDFKECACDADDEELCICSSRNRTISRILSLIISSRDAIATALCSLVYYLPYSLLHVNAMIKQQWWRPDAEQAHVFILALMTSKYGNKDVGNTGTFRQVIEDLSHRGMDVNGYSCQACPTPYLLALQESDIEVCEFLVRRGAKPKALPSLQYATTQLGHAAARGNRHMIELMLELGADVNGVATKAPQHSDTCPLASRDEHDLNLFDRYLQNIVDFLDRFYCHGSRQAKSKTAIQLAAYGGHLQCVSVLISSGADVNTPPLTEWSGRTALQAACEKGNLELVQLLLNHGANVNAPASAEYGVTALQAAAIKGYFYIAQILIGAGADVGAPASPIEGRTAIDGAAERGGLDMVAYLLDNYKGDESTEAVCERASGYARKQGHMAVVDFLAAYRQHNE